MMKAEKGSEIITTICEYENSVAMPDNERLTYLDTCGIARLKDGNGNVKAQEAYASRCSEYLRFGHEVDLARLRRIQPLRCPESLRHAGDILEDRVRATPHALHAEASLSGSHAEIRLQPPPARLLHRTGQALSRASCFPGSSRQQSEQGRCSTCHSSRDRCLRHPAHRGHQAGRCGELRRARSGDEYGLERLQQAKLHPLLRPDTGYGCLRVRKRQENRSARRPIRASACGKLLRSRY